MKWKRRCRVSGGAESEVLYLSDSSKLLAQRNLFMEVLVVAGFCFLF